MTRKQWVAEVLDWVGTPFKWQGRSKGSQGGVDCWGLIVGAGHATGYLPADWDVRDYSRRTDLVALSHEHLPSWFDEGTTDDLQAGDVVTFHKGAGSMHMGVLYDHERGGLGIVHSEDWLRIVKHRLTDDHRRTLGQVWRPRYTGDE